MARALRPRGVYVLDLTCQASEGAVVTTTDEAWEMTRGAVTVRGEDDAVYVSDAGTQLRLAWGVEGHLRGYTVSAFAARVGACPDFTLESWHPEASRATGVGEFSVEASAAPPVGGRAMVVLRRR